MEQILRRKTLLEGARKLKHKIMIVDDSRVVYAEMKKLLEGSEIEIVGFCRSGEAALEEYESINPDLVTMDIVMPGIDGLEASQRMLEKWPDAKILMVSSLAYERTIQSAEALGTKGFIFKPFTREDLINAITKALEEPEA